MWEVEKHFWSRTLCWRTGRPIKPIMGWERLGPLQDKKHSNPQDKAKICQNDPPESMIFVLCEIYLYCFVCGAVFPLALRAENSLINLVRRRLLNQLDDLRPLDSLISEALLPGNAVFSRTNAESE